MITAKGAIFPAGRIARYLCAVALLLLACAAVLDASAARVERHPDPYGWPPRPSVPGLHFRTVALPDVRLNFESSEILRASPEATWLPLSIAITGLLAHLLLLTWFLRERRRRLTADLHQRAMIAQVGRTSRIATAGTLSASISHELTQPITGMMASANAALRWLAGANPDLDKARAALLHVTAAGERAAEIICGVRSRFRIDVENETMVDVNALVVSVLRLVDAEMAARNIAVHEDLDRQLPRVLGDEVMLRHALFDLVMNGAEAMAAIPHRRVLRVTTVNRDHEIVVSVADAGIGLPEAQIVKLFDPGFTTRQGGVGMGLAISRRIVEGHNGRIWASTGDPCGTVVQFALPVSPPRGSDAVAR